jgi:hypothetical protein
MGWDFTLAAGETATISFVLREIEPLSGFYLSQTDLDSDFGNGYTFYLSSALRISGGVPTPEPSILYLLGIGMLGLTMSRRRMKQA